MNVLGLIAGILGILGSGYVFVDAMNRPSTESSSPIFIALVAMAFVIVGLVGSTMKVNYKKAGLLMLLGVVGGLLTLVAALSASPTPIGFMIGIVTTILFIIGGIISLKKA